jgi:N-acyl-D-aspartate/D-glutamate deacylase
MDVTVPGWEWANGLRVSEVARRWRCSGLEALLRLGEQSRGAALMLYHRLSGEPDDEGALEAVLSHPACLFETDAVHRRAGCPNPAGLGAYPRVLGEYCRRRGLFPLAEAVRRMTAASAERFKLRDRGRVRAGLAADLVAFAPATVDDAVSLDRAAGSGPRGVAHVFLNGTQVVRDGRYLGGARKGRVLRA